MIRVHSGQRGPFMQDIVMIRLGSRGSDCSMGASSTENSVNSLDNAQAQQQNNPTLPGRTKPSAVREHKK